MRAATHEMLLATGALALIAAAIWVFSNTHLFAAGSGEAKEADERPFEGVKALVLEPENFWGWDAAIFGALQERRFDVAYVKPEVLDDYGFLSQHDLVASNIKRSFTPAQVANLRRFVAQGGALYGSWGGPMGAADLLREVCHVSQTRSVRITRMTLLDGTPLIKGITERTISFPKVVGHLASGSWEIVSVAPTEAGIPVAQDAAGNVLGVLGESGKGRTAVLGFGPEQDKHFAKRELGPMMMDNLLGWLLEDRMKSSRPRWPGTVEVSLPARAQVLGVFLNGRQVANPQVQEFGSLRKVKVNVQSVSEGREATIRVTYKPLAAARNVETVIHLPWASFPRGGPPGRLAEWLRLVHATMCQPLLREANGHAYYKGMPEDTPDPVSVGGYEGNFLADFVGECHRRGIKVIGGLYFETRTTLKRHPGATVVNRDGQRVATQACFNNPKGQEFNLATVRHLLDNYRLDGIVLDDNFELQAYDCCCQHCSEGFRAYCARKGIAPQEPSHLTDSTRARHWHDYKLEATRDLAAKVKAIAHQHNVPAGGWVGAGMGAAHLGQTFDFLGGMVYTEPPRAARLMLSALGKCKFITLLWAPSEMLDRMEQEAREAVHAGSATVGFWVYPPGHQGSGAFRMLEGSSEAIARAFASVEEEWLKFYRDNMLCGDARFRVLGGKVGREQMTLRVVNAGERTARRVQGSVDLEAITPVTTSLSFRGPSGRDNVTEFVAVGNPFRLTVTLQNLRSRVFRGVPVRLSLPEDMEIVQGNRESTMDLAGHSSKAVEWVLRKKREGMSFLRCSVSADASKPEEREITLVGKQERALEVVPNQVDFGTLDAGAKGNSSLTLDNRGLSPTENTAVAVVGRARQWVRVEGVPKSLQAPDWRAGIPSTDSFQLVYDIPRDAATGKYEAELVIAAEGFQPRHVPVTFEVTSLEGLTVAVVRSDNMNWPESTNERIYTLLKSWSGEEEFALIGLRRGDARLLDPTYLRRIHMLYYGSLRDVPQDVSALAEVLESYVKDGGWLVGDGYGFAWAMIDIRPELRDLTGMKWAHPNSNDGFSNARALRVTARHPLSEGLEADKELPMGFADYGGTVYRLTPVLSDLTIPIVLRDSEKEYPYVAIRDLGKGRCLLFSPLMGVFAEQYKTRPAEIILRNLIRWRKAEWGRSR